MLHFSSVVCAISPHPLKFSGSLKNTGSHCWRLLVHGSFSFCRNNNNDILIPDQGDCAKLSEALLQWKSRRDSSKLFNTTFSTIFSLEIVCFTPTVSLVVVFSWMTNYPTNSAVRHLLDFSFLLHSCVHSSMNMNTIFSPLVTNIKSNSWKGRRRRVYIT